MTTNVAVLDDYQRVALTFADWSDLRQRANVTVFDEYIAGEDNVISALRPFDVVVAMRERTPFPAHVIAALPRLKLLITTGPTNAAIDVPAAKRHGIMVCGTGGNLHSTSELTWGLIHAVTRNIPREDQAIRDGRWQSSVGPELGGHTLGIVGLGQLGQRVARVARAFDMNIIAWSQNLAAQTAADHGARLVTKDELFAESDIITVHLQLSERTIGLIGERELGLMKPTAYVVNTSRGPIVQEAPLVAALQAGSIAGAALDVYDTEPLPADHPFRSLPNTVLTPHIGYVAQDIYRIFYTDIVEDISGWLDGSPVRVIT